MAFSWLGFTFICEIEIIELLYGYRTIVGLLPCRKVHHKRVWEEFTVWWKLSQHHVGWVGSKPPHLSCVYKVRIFKIFFSSIGSHPYSKVSVIPLPLSWLMRGIGSQVLLPQWSGNPNSVSRYNLRIMNSVVTCPCGLHIPFHVSVHTDSLYTPTILKNLWWWFRVSCAHLCQLLIVTDKVPSSNNPRVYFGLWFQRGQCITAGKVRQSGSMEVKSRTPQHFG